MAYNPAPRLQASFIVVLLAIFVSVQLFTMFMDGLFTWLQRDRWRKPEPKPKPKSSSSESTLAASQDDPCATERAITTTKSGMSQATGRTRVPAVLVDERGMYSVLGSLFEKGTYEVALDRDMYSITAPRQLTAVSSDILYFPLSPTRVEAILTTVLQPETKTFITCKW
jgi:hypothetical protein